ncbi:MAG: MGMT family protein [Cytophagales bacterium]|nr:MGMT family protein [Cytophagales bacterium]
MKDIDIFKDVLEIVAQIPKGRVSTYGAIARALYSGGSARMVGWALNSSRGRIPYVPAHRVVNRVGQLTGQVHFSKNLSMKELLEREGIRIKDNRVVDFHKVFWNPLSLADDISDDI